MSLYPNLEKPITFRGMTVKNRVFPPPMKTNYIKADHSMSEDIIQYYEDMAKGGIGLVTTEAAEIDGEHLYDATMTIRRFRDSGNWRMPYINMGRSFPCS